MAPRRLIEPGPTAQQLQQLVLAAAQAPDHERQRPWRLIEVPRQRRVDLGRAFEAALLERDPQADPDARTSAFDKAQRAPCLLLAVVRQPQNTDDVPLSERLISLGCAIQNLLLAAQSMGYGSGLTSGQAMASEPLRKLFGLAAHEQAICFVNVGTVSAHKAPRPRPEVSEVFTSL
ncbi:MAG: hypothetical protein RL364_576 [Pseudomonadota bacterium]